MKITYIGFICLAILLSTTDAVYAVNDTVRGNINNNSSLSYSYPIRNKWIQGGIAPAILITSGALTWNGRKATRAVRNRYVPNFSNHLDDYMQYAPAAGVFALKLAGVKGLNRIGRTTVNWVTGMLIVGALVNPTKYITRVLRPDGSSFNSFPSGHTAMAFMNAAMLHKEYGGVNVAYGIAGYSMGAFTGIERGLNNRHWISDVLVGAGIGLLSTELAYMIVNRFYGNQGDYFSDFPAYSSRKEINNYSHLAMRMGYSFYFADKGLSSTGTESAIEGSYYFNKKWGIGGELIFVDHPFKMGRWKRDIFKINDMYLGNPKINMQSIGMFNFMTGPQYAQPLGSNFLLQVKAVAGLSTGIKGRIDGVGDIRNVHGDDKKPTPANFLITEYKPLPAFVCGTGLSITGILSSHTGISMFVDYKYSKPAFKFKFPEQYSIQQQPYSEHVSINNLSIGFRLTTLLH